MSSSAPNITASNGFDITQYSLDVNIMRVALILFSAVIFIVVGINIVHLYMKCVVRRRQRRMGMNHRTIQQVDIRFTEFQVNSREPPKHGLEPSVIASLPTFAYRSVDRVDETDAKECTVCLGNLEDEEMVKVLPNCKHMFHVPCIDTWLNTNSTCPVCRTVAKPLVPTGDTQGPSELIDEISDVVIVQVDPPADSSNSMTSSSETEQDVGVQSVKEGESGESVSGRRSSFQRILSRGRSSWRIQQSGQSEGDEDLERQ